MQLDNIFEDLEAQFDFALETRVAKSPSQTSNLVRVRSQDARTVEMIRPLIGQDFIAGMVLGAKAFRVYRFAFLSQLEFLTLLGVKLAPIQRTSLSTTGFLENVTLPSAISWSTFGDSDMKAGVLEDLVGELLVVNLLEAQAPLGVPVAALSCLQIDSVDNRDNDV